MAEPIKFPRRPGPRDAELSLAARLLRDAGDAILKAQVLIDVLREDGALPQDTATASDVLIGFVARKHRSQVVLALIATTAVHPFLHAKEPIGTTEQGGS